MNNKYKWTVETVADYGYPMMIVQGAFYDAEDEAIAGIPTDMYLSSQWWSGDSGSMNVGPDKKAVPSSMHIKWFSVAEDKFYEGLFQMDSEKMQDLFSKGYTCEREGRNEKDNYSALKVALAPGGQLYLYLSGSNTVLVGNYQAKEYWVKDFNKGINAPVHVEEIDRKEFVADFVKEMPLQTQREVAKKDISMHIWKDINLRYSWKYTVEVEESADPELIMQESFKSVTFLSGEQTWCLAGGGTTYFTEASPKAIPLEIKGNFNTAGGRKFTIRLYPGNVDGIKPKYQKYPIRRAREQELVKLFRDFYEKIGKEPFEIQLLLSEDYASGKVYLKYGEITEEIPNTEVQIFDKTFGN